MLARQAFEDLSAQVLKQREPGWLPLKCKHPLLFTFAACSGAPAVSLTAYQASFCAALLTL